MPSGLARILPHGPIHALNKFRMLWASGILMHMSQWAQTITLGWLALTLTTSAAVVGPSGKLPLSFPKRAADLSCFDRDATQITCDLWHGYRKLLRDGSEPASPSASASATPPSPTLTSNWSGPIWERRIHWP